MLIKNGFIVTGQCKKHADIRIVDGVVKEIFPTLDEVFGEEVIDAQGMWVMPGGIDVHTHMNLDLGHVIATDDFYTGTVAAACGGTTTIVDHIGFGPRGCSIGYQIDAYHEMAKNHAVIDYSFHGVMNRVDEGILNELEELKERGITSHKIYLTYGGKLTPTQIQPLFDRAKELGILICVHAEDDEMVRETQDKYISEGNLEPKYHPLSRPAECEAEAIETILFQARMAGNTPLYIVHLTSRAGLKKIQKARKRGQQYVYAETCPQYLLLDDSRYEGKDGLKYIMSPPLRKEEDQEVLWDGLKRGMIQTVATDHCPFNYWKEKQMGADDFTKAPGGIPGVETRMALLFSEGVGTGRLAPEQFVQIVSERPARLFGMYPRKGTIKPGSDGDIVIFDPKKKVTITHSMLHENVDYTPYEGKEVTGWPVMTISRGNVVAKNGKFTGKKGGGEFISRNLPELM